MAGRKVKKLADMTKHLTNEEIEQRKDMEKSLFEYPELGNKAPDWLSGRALTEWNRIVPYLKQNTPVSELDRSLLATYCKLYSVVQTCNTDITKHGLVITNKDNGSKKKNPYIEIMSTAIKDMKAIANDLGMTISSRARMELHKAKSDKPKDEYEAMLS